MRSLLILAAILIFGAGVMLAAPYDAQLAPKIDVYLAGKGSPIGNGVAFFNNGVTYNVDPRLIVAIAGDESTFGTHWVNCVPTGYNAWSWLYGGGCKRSPFPSYAAGIATVTKYMRRSFLNKGRTTIPTIGAKYCTAGCSAWVSTVTGFYVEQGGNTSDLTFYGTVITFEQFSGGSPYFGSVQPPLTIGIATISGGQILSNATYLPGDESTVYGTADFCSGCAPSINLAFATPVFNVSLFLYNGETFPVTYTVSDDQGDTQTVTLQANAQSGFSTVKLPGENVKTVTITSNGSPFDFEIDNVRFAPQGTKP